MTDWLETVRDTANSWECDENDHINIKSYAHRFDIAARHHAAQVDVEGHQRSVRVIRYHAELLGGEPVHGVSRAVRLEDGALGVEHRLFATQRGDGKLSATALDRLAAKASPDLPTPSDDAAPRNGWRDLSVEGQTPEPPRKSFTSLKGVLAPDGFAPTGERLSDQTIVGLISDAATHAWAFASAPDDWFRARGWGRAAVQLQLAYGETPKAGALVEMRSQVVAFSAKSVSYQHTLVDLDRNAVVAVGAITSVMLNLTTRRAEAWPDENLRLLETLTS